MHTVLLLTTETRHGPKSHGETSSVDLHLVFHLRSLGRAPRLGRYTLGHSVHARGNCKTYKSMKVDLGVTALHPPLSLLWIHQSYRRDCLVGDSSGP